MLFRKNKNHDRKILRLGITINISELGSWMDSQQEKIPLVSYQKWVSSDNFEYQIFVVPADEENDWYFHKSPAEFSQSVDAIVDLEGQFSSDIDIDKICMGLQPYMEIELWNGMLAISFCRKLLLIAPLQEAVSLQNTGKTSIGSIASPSDQEIEVPVAFSEKSEPTDFIRIHEQLDGRGAMYSNQLVLISLDVPRGPVLMDSQ